MNPIFWPVMALFIITSIISIRFGFSLGVNATTKKINDEILKEIHDRIEKNYMDRLTEEFQKAVEIRAHEIVDEAMEEIEEKEKENESSDSN